MQGFIPTDVFLYRTSLFINGLKRTMGAMVVQKLPITPELLLRIHQLLDFTNSFHCCMWAAMLFLFFSFFRKSNVLPDSDSSFDPQKVVTRSSIIVTSSHLLVAVTWSKTIQYKQRCLIVPLSSVPGSKLCPVSAYKQLLRSVPVCNKGHALYCVNHSCVPLTYPTFTKYLRMWLTMLGVLHPQLYSAHSFRRGGASWAFHAGVPPALIKVQGDWRSQCYMQYIKLSMSDRLLTTSKMAQALTGY